MSGRLRGTAFQLAMALSRERQRGPTSLVTVVVGEELLAEPEIPQFQAQDDGSYIASQDSDVNILIGALRT